MPPLSDEQYTLVEHMTQIYRAHTLEELYGEEEGQRIWKRTVNEVIAQLGKGSGKNFCSIIAVARVVYLLLCLKDPARYFDKPRGNTIDILNIAINATQAENIFFNPLKDLIRGCPWFAGKFETRKGEIVFDKNIRCFSGHSEREGWEGYNLIMCILDEISGFALESTSGNEQAKTAKAIYEMYRASVDSRFAEGKLILLSFPRFKGDFIQQRYEEAIAHKEQVRLTHKFKLHEDQPDGIAENEFEVAWEEDRIVAYREPNVYAIRRPTWKINPTRSLESLKGAFFRNSVDALSRFACMPPEAIDAFFKDRERVEAAFPIRPRPFKDNWQFEDWFQPTSDEYYVHVDLGYTHDRAAVALAHVEEWVHVKYGQDWEEPAPVVKIDAIRWWTPKPEHNVDFAEIKNYIFSLRRRGFNLRLVTFDQWQSIDMINDLQRAGIQAERLSVAKPHYTDLALLIAESRLRGYYEEILLEELLALRIIKGDKVDHPRKGSNDLADAVCGAAYNAAAYSRNDAASTVEVRYLGDRPPENPVQPQQPSRAPGPNPAVQDFLARMQVV